MHPQWSYRKVSRTAQPRNDSISCSDEEINQQFNKHTIPFIKQHTQLSNLRPKRCQPRAASDLSWTIGAIKSSYSEGTLRLPQLKSERDQNKCKCHTEPMAYHCSTTTVLQLVISFSQSSERQIAVSKTYTQSSWTTFAKNQALKTTYKKCNWTRISQPTIK